ncbi:hypothetical protein PAH45_18745, partial [Klebsiella quasipneumoniae]|uniref:hypothetical protein n=1 Tax=Klebsiella quasipneumoniae TaxID=1463165 RepID=UPI00284526C9
PRKRSAAGHGHSQGGACMPGGGYALPGLQTKHSASRGISQSRRSALPGLPDSVNSSPAKRSASRGVSRIA